MVTLTDQRKKRDSSDTLRAILVVVLLFAALLASSCDGNENLEPIQKEPKPDLPEKSADLIKSSNTFGFEMFKILNEKEKKDKNIFVSPTSVSMALAMAYNGADTKTKTEMEKVLGFAGYSRQQINETFQQLANLLENINPKIQLDIANSIWYRSGFPIYSDFINANQTYYDAEVAELDFANQKESLKIINGWVAENTNNKIKEILDGIPPEAMLYLINAVYFKANWKYKFDKKNTHNMDFFTSNNKPISVPFMYLNSDLNVYNDENLQAVELPYSDDSFSMLVLLPQKDKSVNQLVELLDDKYWNTINNSLQEEQDIKLYFPKFKFEYKTELQEILAIQGMPSAFAGDADFSKISSMNLFISRVIHKSYVDVNEEGTEAAAVTAIEFEFMSVTSEKKLKINRPFLFAIQEKSTGSIVFIGKINEPVIE